MKQIKKVINWYIGRVYKFNDPEYKKLWRRSYAAVFITIIAGFLVMIFWRPALPTAGKAMWQTIFLFSWTFLIGAFVGSSSFAESADRYQAKKKKDNLPTL